MKSRVENKDGNHATLYKPIWSTDGFLALRVPQ